MVLKRSGFSDYFISCFKLMYEGAQALNKINSKLLSPIEFNSGVKQWAPSSAALYCLALGPFLVYLKNQMEGHGLNVLGHTFITSAYADDLCIICTKEDAFEIVNQSLELYASSSSAKIILLSRLVCDVVLGEKEKIHHWVSNGQTMELNIWGCFGVTL